MDDSQMTTESTSADDAARRDGSRLSEGLGAGAGALERFDVVTGTFQPQRTDDLKPHARAWVGVRMRWCAAWEIDVEDGGPYVGQMAMTPHGPTPSGLEPLGWVPLCDLANVEAPNAALEWQARLSNESRNLVEACPLEGLVGWPT